MAIEIIGESPSSADAGSAAASAATRASWKRKRMAGSLSFNPAGRREGAPLPGRTATRSRRGRDALRSRQLRDQVFANLPLDRGPLRVADLLPAHQAQHRGAGRPEDQRLPDAS